MLNWELGSNINNLIMNRTNEELYNDYLKGDRNAWDTLMAEACAGDADAQYYVYCTYSSPDSSLYDKGIAFYWLRKSAERGHDISQKKIQSLTKEQKMRYGIEIENKDDEDINYEDIRPGGIWSSRGRIDRMTFFVYYIVYALIGGLAFFLIGLIPLETVIINDVLQPQPTMFALTAYLIVSLIMGYLVIVLAAKRLHDCGRSSVLAILAVVPLVPFVFLFLKGEEKTNQYGPRPE